MHTERGIVERIEDHWAWILTQRKDMCDHCEHRGHCHMVEGMDRMMVKAKNVARARKGDEVEFYLSTKTKLKGLIILYMFPVIGLLVGAFSGSSLSGPLGLNKNVGLILFTLTGLILAFLLARFLAGRMEARQELTPTISRVVRRATKGGIPLQAHVTDSASSASHGEKAS